ncbi:MAG: phosphatidylglycerophosphatase A [Ignavibacteria bacterium]
MKENNRNSNKDFIWLPISSAFGLGLLPIAPGSFGALLGVLIHIILKNLVDNYLVLYILAAIIIFWALSYYSLKWSVIRYNNHDPKNFVLDEVVGYLITALFTFNMNFYLSVALCYILFRVFDVVKVPPAYQIDKKMLSFWGVMLDDVVSAIYAVIAVKLIDYFL